MAARKGESESDKTKGPKPLGSVYRAVLPLVEAAGAMCRAVFESQTRTGGMRVAYLSPISAQTRVTVPVKVPVPEVWVTLSSTTKFR